MRFFARKKHTEVKRLQAEKDNEDMETASNMSEPANKSTTVENNSVKKPVATRNASYIIHPMSKKGQKEFILQGFGPGKTRAYKDDNDNVYYNLRLHAISRGGKRGSVVQPLPMKWHTVDPKWILPKRRQNSVSKRVDLSLYREFPKVPMAAEIQKQLIENEHSQTERENKRKAVRVNQHDETVELPIISENTYKVRYPDLAPQVVPHDINNNKLRDELYIGYGWAGDNESLQTISKKLYRYREVSFRNSIQSLERGRENIAHQRREIENYKEPPKTTHGETFDDYLCELNECKLDDDKPTGQIPTPRIRRKIWEGSYPNWSVLEDELPTLLRYTWKAKQNKIIQYLQDETKHYKINNEDNQGRTALHYAASWGCIKILKILLRVPGIEVNKRDKDGKTPLYKAAEQDSSECVQALVEAGANCRIPARDSRDPLTAIMHLYGDKRFNMFQMLFKLGCYGDDEVQPYFLTLLHKAIASDKDKVNLRIVNFLIENGQDINAKEGKSRTPLHLAARCGRADLLYILLAHGANIFHVDDKMKYANHYVSQIDIVIRDILDEFYEHGPPSLILALKYRETDKHTQDVSSISRHQM